MDTAEWDEVTAAWKRGLEQPVYLYEILQMGWKQRLAHGLSLLPISGGEFPADRLGGGTGVDDGGGEGTDLDAGQGAPGEGAEGLDEGEGAEGAEAGAEGADGEVVYQDGERNYTATQLREALHSHANRRSWETKHKQRDMRDAEFYRVTQEAFGKDPHMLDRVDLADFRSFGGFNARLRSDPEFKQDFEYTLRAMQNPRVRQAFQQALRTAGVARGGAVNRGSREPTAGRDGAGGADRTADLAPLERRLSAVEQDRQSEREERALMVLGDRIERETSAAIQPLQAQGINTKRWGRWLRSTVLSALHPYDDVELARMARDGRLKDEIDAVTKEAVKTIREDESERTRGRATAVADARRGAPPAPLRGAPGRRAAAEVPNEQGRGLSGFHEKFRREFMGEQ